MPVKVSSSDLRGVSLTSIVQLIFAMQCFRPQVNNPDLKGCLLPTNGAAVVNEQDRGIQPKLPFFTGTINLEERFRRSRLPVFIHPNHWYHRSNRSEPRV